MSKTTLLLGDSFVLLKEIESESIDSIVTDPPLWHTDAWKRLGRERY